MMTTKTLVILLGETRAHELTYQNIKTNVIDRLDADLCVCIGVKPDYDYENPFYQLAKHRFVYHETEDYAGAWDEAAAAISAEQTDNMIHQQATIFGLAENLDPPPLQPWRDYLQIKDQFMGGIKDAENEHPGSGAILIFYRWFLLQNLKKHGLIEQYDRFVITRSDYIYRIPHPRVDYLDPAAIWIPNDEGYGGFTDRHVILSRANIEAYLNILPALLSPAQRYFDTMREGDEKEWNLEKLIRLHLTKQGVVDLVREIPYVMFTVRAPNGTTRWRAGVFSPDDGYYVKYPTEYYKSLAHLEQYVSVNLDIDEYYRRWTGYQG